MTSKERVRATMRHQAVDHLPLTIEGLCHGWANFANARYPDPFTRIPFFLELGLDAGVMFEYPFEAFPESVSIREWEEPSAEPGMSLLYKEYATPRGPLRQVIRATEEYQPLVRQDPVPDADAPRSDYTAGTHVPLFCDHHVPPTRSQQYLIDHEAQLERLECLFDPLSATVVDEFSRRLRAAKRFCDAHQIVLSLYAWGVGDPLMWLSGVERVLDMAMEEPETLHRYIDIIDCWQRRVLEVAIGSGVDHIVRRGWYESTDFWSPSLYREFLLPPLREHVALAHQADVTVDYVMASGSAPLLAMIADSGVDMLSNLDPLAPNTDLRAYRQAFGGTVALCGGINNYDVIEQGSEEEVRQATLEAIDIFTPATGCMLAPADVLFLGDPAVVERNFHVMVDTWKKAAW